ncbi:hypothetical protein L7F22_012920 [Adiantum nelumboides]|nr:hypothetical protein [Adiantum nelumboides]
MSPRVREATHAGSWYVSSGKKLDQQLSEWLAQVEPSTIPSPPRSVIDVDVEAESRATTADDGGIEMPAKGLKAVIAPHAGYSYSGPAAAWAYASIDPSHNSTRVFILGPSHHLYLDGCALSSCDAYATPLGDLPIDKATVAELRSSGQFERDMKLDVDEAEHSIEMHLPYIRKVFQDHEIGIVPILVGSISTKKEGVFGKLLAPYLADPTTLFVTSSDFCHWRVSPLLPFVDEKGPKSAADARESFAGYLAQTKNTICGRHPIGVLLGALEALEEKQERQQHYSTELRFTRYEQSSKCETARDSSVSYASAIVKFNYK